MNTKTILLSLIVLVAFVANPSTPCDAASTCAAPTFRSFVPDGAKPDGGRRKRSRTKSMHDKAQNTESLNERLIMYSQAIALDSACAECYFYRALTYLHMPIDFGSVDTNTALALADFNQAIRLDSTSVRYYYNRYNLYRSMGNTQLALDDLTRIIALDSLNPLYYSMRGDLYYSIPNYKSALADYRAALALDSADAYLPLKIYNTVDNMYTDEMMLADYLHGLNLSPEHADAFQTVLPFSVFPEAELRVVNKFKENSYKFTPRDPGNFLIKGVSYQYAGSHQQALVNYNTAIEMDSALPLPTTTGASPSSTWAATSRLSMILPPHSASSPTSPRPITTVPMPTIALDRPPRLLPTCALSCPLIPALPKTITSLPTCCS